MTRFQRFKPGWLFGRVTVVRNVWRLEVTTRCVAAYDEYRGRTDAATDTNRITSRNSRYEFPEGVEAAILMDGFCDRSQDGRMSGRFNLATTPQAMIFK